MHPVLAALFKSKFAICDFQICTFQFDYGPLRCIVNEVSKGCGGIPGVPKPAFLAVGQRTVALTA